MATAPQPVNYTGLQVPSDPVGAFMKSQNLQSGTNLQNAQAMQAGAMANMQQFQLQRQQQYYPMLQQVLQNPTPSNFAALTAMFPDQHEALTASYNESQTGQRQAAIQPVAQAYSAMLNNRPDLALNIVQQQRDALVNSNTDPSDPAYQQKLQHFDALIGQINTDPKAATGLMGASLSSILPPDEFEKNFAGFMSEPATVGKANADATTAQATASVAPQQAQANLDQTQANVANINNQMQQRVANFGLDQQKFQTDTQIRMQQLRYQQMVPNMAPGMAEQQATAVGQSQQLQQSADRAKVAFNPRTGFITPRQLGPMSRILPRIVCAICRSSSFPCSPCSLKPAEMTMAPGMPSSTASAMRSGTVSAGVETTTRSTLSGRSLRLGYALIPSTLGRFEFTGKTVPPKGLLSRFHSTDRPTLPARSEAPTTATLCGRNNGSRGWLSVR